MTRPGFAIAGGLVLAAVWIWPLPHLGAPPFSAHMTMHMAVVAVAAPLLALGLAGGRWDLAVRAPVTASPIAASVVELIAVWSWHTPALHHLARHTTVGLVTEQATFLVTGWWLWAAAVGGTAQQRRTRATAGITGLLLTSMHMTLLGALIALATRELYGHHHHAETVWGLTPLLDQQLGGAIMLLVGGVAYLSGGLGLTAEALLRTRKEGG